jgi:hypothetical protein
MPQKSILDRPMPRFFAASTLSTILAIGILITFSLLSATTSALAQQANEQNQVFVEVATARLRQQPKHWAPGTIDLAFGTPLTELSRDNGWYRVKTGQGQEGFIHESAITSRKVVFDPQAGSHANVNVKPDDSDVVLAGKGFNKELESGLSSSRKELNFAAVDSLQKTKVTDAELA